MLFATPLCALDTKPWLGDVYAFNFESAFSYMTFPKVEGARIQLKAPEQSRNLLFALGMTPSASLDVQLEGEFGKTNGINWALRSGAMQARLALFNDIAGDPFSLVCGVNVRGVPTHFLHSVSTPYAAECNVELTTSLGKEWAQGRFWKARTYGFVALGQANRGFPWVRPSLVGEYQWAHEHRVALFVNGEVGCGGKQGVDVNHFQGWGTIQHSSLDVGMSYGYRLSVYGTLTASYARRVYAHNFPAEANLFILSYTLPFSLI